VVLLVIVIISFVWSYLLYDTYFYISPVSKLFPEKFFFVFPSRPFFRLRKLYPTRFLTIGLT